MRCRIALVALLFTVLPREARAEEPVSPAAMAGTPSVDDPADEQDDELLDESSVGLENQDMTWHGDGPAPPGEPVEIGRHREFLYLVRQTDHTRYGKRVWCICELPSTSHTIFDGSVSLDSGDEAAIAFRWTEEEYNTCIAFGVLAGSALAGVSAFILTAPKTPADLAAAAVTAESRAFLVNGAVAMGAFVGTVVALRICPKPEKPGGSRPTYTCPNGCPGGCPFGGLPSDGQCPCPGPGTPNCPPGCPQEGGICKSLDLDEDGLVEETL
jgi:hypothetical protein